MKEIKAYIKPKRAQVVIEALTETGIIEVLLDLATARTAPG